MARNLKQEEIEEIIRVFESGVGVNETARRLKTSKKTVWRYVGKHRRSHADSISISQELRTRKLTDEGRAKLSAGAKRCCQKGGKIWTKPERKFKQLLNECNIGVKFSSDVKELFLVTDDQNATVCFQYPLQRYVCDFVDIEAKIVYAVNGDFWHANPLLYPSGLTAIQKHNVHHDIQRERYLTGLGYRVCVVWESEINWNPELVKDKIRAVSSEAVASGLHPEGRDFKILTAHLDWSQKVKSLWFKEPREKRTVSISCAKCGMAFFMSANNKKCENRKYCSQQCRLSDQRKVERPSREHLLEMRRTLSWTAIGKLYGVSDNAVRKWVKYAQKDNI